MYSSNNFFNSILFLFVLLIFVLTGSTGFAQKSYETGEIEYEFKKTESFTSTALSDILLLPKEKYFNRINLDEDIQRLNKFYFDNGFFDVIIDTSTVTNEEDEEIDVKFIIIENTRYTIKEIRLQGLDSIPQNVKNEIAADRVVNAGEPYSRSKINQEKDRIINILQSNGYFYAQIDTVISRQDSSRRGIIIGKYSEEVQKNPEFKNKVLLRMRFIGTRDIFIIGPVSIKILNNRYGISDDVIRRELLFKEGEIFNKTKILESERNFGKLAIIQLGRVVPDTVHQESHIIPLNVSISLNKKYEITPRVSVVYQSNRLFGGAGLEYRDKDFFGGGRVFTAGIEGLYNSVDINNVELSLSIYQPFLFRNNITTTFTTTFGLYNFSKQLEFLYSQNLLRTSYFIANHTFYNNAFFDFTFDYIRSRAKEDFLDFTENDTIFTPKGTKSYSQNSILGLTLIHNNANRIFNPSALFTKDLNYYQYVKLYTNNSFYFDISGDRATTIFAANFELGDIIEYGSGENIIPIDVLYKFFSGGGNSVRGWRAQKNGILDNTENGGKFIIEGSFEIRRRPFPQRSFFYPIWGVVFLDWGNVWESDGLFRLDQIALATGFGIRYDTFVGPVRIDLGFRLYDPMAKEGEKWLWEKPSDIFKSKYAIQFGLGNAF
jgi:outer membrane protein assembly factor BamA